MLFNKRADISGRKMIFYLIVGFVLIAAFFIVVTLVSSDKSIISKIPPDLENYLTIQRFLSSPECFTLYDQSISRAYPSIIDINKFNQINLNRCYDAENTLVKSYRLTLKYGDQQITINTKNWQGFIKKSEIRQIFVNNNGKTDRAEIYIEVQDAK
ncbi:hypothetical protein HYW20_01440 [Candidatus Woesearchaeota archaeon]|nr:hypothetical protein [Candidatus Woesearchaeota archaeon]